ncbi:MAG: hypothetical protein NT082_06765 [Chloroflexi bacterium]|nr:hypothetical protein [Chloroflexota bacterium]
MSKNIQVVIQVLLLLTLFAYGITGYGITEFRIVETLTLGLITKPVAFQIHNNLMIPFLILLLLHIFFKPVSKAIYKGNK